MKKVVKLGVFSLSVMALASCSTLESDNLGATNSQNKDKATEVSSSSKAAAPTAKVSLKQSSQGKIVAIIVTNYNNNPEGSVKLQWKAPSGTSCYDTSFPITKYGEKNDKTWASVETKQGGNYCKGTWSANVVYGKNVIATDSITI
ncbi:hypothetical protein IB642_03330 [Allofrancisella guangzhouensis]|uniref:Membrane protein n=1 Tax=Allofrancisella guangzhouensis TaxID=594679 RepID=A0A0A8E670_9GAMM|nr:TUL4 family lipoprotein [Allofrancisella guangzhouensis]AJC49503.1 membrane protein [Allofrancisella guangzhouensis]MBK2026871.1 hypothetical protein [Allofrancisella guangzhouensis]MBK2044050.1 hypothetical protein [Allofrancisella guangzhouensis]MBK2045913.1 hypothetical protein [Allofrancisella guangzhouensis]